MKFLKTIPVLPSADIKRDLLWYEKYLGFKLIGGDEMYAVLRRIDIDIHLQWHADTKEEPLLAGSVVRFWVEDIHSIFNEIVKRGGIQRDKLSLNTAWGTNEFGLYDLNKNALFFFEDVTTQK